MMNVMNVAIALSMYSLCWLSHTALTALAEDAKEAHMQMPRAIIHIGPHKVYSVYPV
jgi:hypothetical protein